VAGALAVVRYAKIHGSKHRPYLHPYARYSTARPASGDRGSSLVNCCGRAAAHGLV
jgi:hypothetical protein